jgi:hypothetical protein
MVVSYNFLGKIEVNHDKPEDSGTAAVTRTWCFPSVNPHTDKLGTIIQLGSAFGDITRLYPENQNTALARVRTQIPSWNSHNYFLQNKYYIFLLLLSHLFIYGLFS